MRDGRYKEGYVIPRPRDKEIKSDSTSSLIKKIRKLSGVHDFVFHGLRHTASTIMVSQALGQGVGLADIMKVLGHSKVETTMKYVHPDFDRMKRAVEILGEKSIMKSENESEKATGQKGE